MTGELVKQIMGSTLVTTMIIAMFSGAWKIVQDKRANRRIDDRDTAEELGDMRAAAEAHILGFDVPMQEGVMQLRAVVNQMRMEQGKEPIAFPPLPSPVPLFPKRRQGD